MSASSEVNLKQTLRKIEYPLCAKEALNKIGKIYSIDLQINRNCFIKILQIHNLKNIVFFPIS